MGRWEPNARGRLEQAAMELYGERGFEQTTVAEIAERAGLTERTFFRYFADKREVLFGGSDEIKAVLVGAVADASASATPLEAVAAGLTALGAVMEERRGVEFARRRQRIIASNDELHERELIKLAGWSSALAGALHERGVDDSTASLAGEVGIAVFRAAFQRWIGEASGRRFEDVVAAAFGDLEGLGAPSAPSKSRQAAR